MSSRRFRRLELDPDLRAPDPDEEARAAEPGWTPGFRRALEVEGALGLDESGAPRTHFCRGCGAENPGGAGACFSCGGPVGGPEQAEFDARVREARAARRRASASQASPESAAPLPTATARPSHGAAHPLPSATDALLEEVLREAEARHEPGFGSILAAGVLLAALFALIWIPVHAALGFGSGAPLRGRGLFELGFAAVGALWLRRRYRRELDGL